MFSSECSLCVNTTLCSLGTHTHTLSIAMSIWWPSQAPGVVCVCQDIQVSSGPRILSAGWPMENTGLLWASPPRAVPAACHSPRLGCVCVGGVHVCVCTCVCVCVSSRMQGITTHRTLPFASRHSNPLPDDGPRLTVADVRQ